MSLPDSSSNKDVSMSSMLLNLPNELFTPVILDVVRNVGVVEAWKLRRVCKTFRIYIEDDILTNTPMSSFGEDDKGHDTSHIFFDNPEQCLLKRCLSSRVSIEANVFPYFLIQLVDRLLQEFPPELDDRSLGEIREAYFTDIIRMLLSGNDGSHLVDFSYNGLEWSLVHRMSCLKPSGYDLAISPPREIDLMVVASATGNLPAVKYFLDQGRNQFRESGRLLSDHLDKGTFLTRLPLEAAVANGKLDIVVLLLNQFRSILRENPSWYSQNRLDRAISIHDRSGDKVLLQLDKAIDKAIAQRKAVELRTLVEFEFQNYDNSDYRFYKLVSTMVEEKSLEMLKLVCDFKTKEYCASAYNCYWWKDLLLSNEHEIIRCLLENELVTVDVQTAWYHGYETPLHWVAKSGQSAVASILIEHGADINCHSTARLGWTPTPLKTAVYFGNLDVARTLVEAGANVYYGSPLTAVINCKRRSRETKDVYEMTRLLVGAGTPVNQRVAWDVEVDAMHEVSSGMRWLKGKSSPELVMGIIVVAAALKAKLPRWHIPYADFRMRVADARKLIVDGDLARSWNGNKVVSPCWPNMYFTSRVLRSVIKGPLKKSIPVKHRKQMVAVARDVLTWLEDKRT